MDYLSIPTQMNCNVNTILMAIVSILLILVSITLIINKNLLKSVVLASISSLLVGILYLLMDAPDVAMTEAALGACLSTCVLLNVVKMVGENTSTISYRRLVPAIIICTLFIGCMAWAIMDLPVFGESSSPIQNHLTDYYIKHTYNDIGIPSMVAAILASYRGFDTLGETIVILIAGIGVVSIMSGGKRTNA